MIPQASVCVLTAVHWFAPRSLRKLVAEGQWSVPFGLEQRSDCVGIRKGRKLMMARRLFSIKAGHASKLGKPARQHRRDIA